MRAGDVSKKRARERERDQLCSDVVPGSNGYQSKYFSKIPQ